jgi:hypothetical protein
MNQQLIENPRLGPTVRRHNSKQDYETPIEFMQAVESRFGKIKVDLAATEKDTKAMDTDRGFLTSSTERCQGTWCRK